MAYFERGDDANVLEVAIIWGVPLLDPTRGKAIIRSLWWTRIITLTLRRTLLRIIHVDDEVELTNVRS